MTNVNDLVAIEAKIQAGLMLVKLGLATVDKVKALIAGDAGDDQILADIRAEAQARIAAREAAQG